MRYFLYYWPEIQGRGEFVRLALEAGGADYVDVARGPPGGAGGESAMLRLLAAGTNPRPPFAPPFLKAGQLLIAQTANILLFLGDRLALAPKAETGRLWAHQLQLTVADLVAEVHDTHHPIAGGLYYEDQRNEALRRASDFTSHRLPKYLGYFEGVLARNRGSGRGGEWMLGGRLSYVDLSMFQVMAGLRYAFPRTMSRLARRTSRLSALHDRVGEQKRIAAYLASERRIPFNEQGIFRHYPELDE